MPTIQILKKKLKSIRSTQKISKAMKTSATVKFSRLNAVLGDYSKYCEEYRRLYGVCAEEYDSYLGANDPALPECLVVMASNKGMCGGFNSQLLNFAEKILSQDKGHGVVIICGKKAQSFFDLKGIRYDRAFAFGDVPQYEEAKELFDCVCSYLRSGKVSRVRLIYPRYINMMTQTPTVRGLFGDGEKGTEQSGAVLFAPDRESVVKETANGMLCAFLFEAVLECALGAQAATLMTMRSAYDTATEYSLQLESEINRKRQSQVTADVIETSAERSQEEY